jgi:hypothetical protein
MRETGRCQKGCEMQMQMQTEWYGMREGTGTGGGMEPECDANRMYLAV